MHRHERTGSSDVNRTCHTTLFAPSGVAAVDVKVTELQDLSTLDQQLQSALDVVQEHGKNRTVQRAAFTAVWNLIVCSKVRNGRAEHDDSAPTVAIQRMIIVEALGVLDVDYTATAKDTCGLHRAVLGALWAILHGSTRALQNEARSRDVHKLVSSTIERARSAQDAQTADLGERVLECLA